MSHKNKRGEVSMSRLPGNRSARFVPYLVPGLIGLLVIVVVPFIWNIYLSFTRWRGVGPVKWIGLKNWQRLMSDSTFWTSFANSFWIIVAIVVTSFRFHLAMDTLAFDYAIPAIRACSGLPPVRQCSCRAYTKKRTLGLTPMSAFSYFISC